MKIKNKITILISATFGLPMLLSSIFVIFMVMADRAGVGDPKGDNVVTFGACILFAFLSGLLAYPALRFIVNAVKNGAR